MTSSKNLMSGIFLIFSLFFLSNGQFFGGDFFGPAIRADVHERAVYERQQKPKPKPKQVAPKPKPHIPKPHIQTTKSRPPPTTTTPVRRTVRPINTVLQYDAVQLITDYTMETLPEVKDINLSYLQMYMHVFEIFSLKNVDLLSFASFEGGTKFDAAGVTLRFPQIAEMYGQGPILSKVLRFCRDCYITEFPRTYEDIWVMVLVGCKTPESCQSIFFKTLQEYKKLPAEKKTGGLMTLGSKAFHGGMLTSMGFKLRTCGFPNHKCDWTYMGLPPEKAKDVCVYLYK